MVARHNRRLIYQGGNKFAIMRVLLISLLPDSHRNLSCLTLYAVAASAGHDVALLFMPNRAMFSEQHLSVFLSDHKYDAVGLSVMTCDFYFAKAVTRILSLYVPKSRIIWGGIHPTCLPEESLGVVDCICRGEGENVFVNWLHALDKHEPIGVLPGLGIRNNDGTIQLNELPPLIENLDDIPWNRYDWDNNYVLDEQGVHRFGMTDYIRYSTHNGDGYTTMTSRSCPLSCAYCINSFLKKLYHSGGAIRRRSVDHVMAELKHARESIPTVRFINFIDDHFLTSSEWTQEFCDKYSVAINLPFIIRASPDALTDRNIKMLKHAGLNSIQTGIQSGSARTHKLIFNRPFNREAIIKASHTVKKYGVLPIYDVIIENDFENDEDRNATLKLLMGLDRPYELNIFVLTPFPKTDIISKYKTLGIQPRIDPYKSGYLDYDENDYYYQMASVIPYIPERVGRYLFSHRDWAARLALNVLYRNIRKRLRNVS